MPPPVQYPTSLDGSANKIVIKTTIYLLLLPSLCVYVYIVHFYFIALLLAEIINFIIFSIQRQILRMKGREEVGGKNIHPKITASQPAFLYPCVLCRAMCTLVCV
jgi:hypothetical protein